MTYKEMLTLLTRRAGSERRAAALFGISQSSFNNWCRGRALPDDEQARKLAELLKLDPAYVLAVIHGERAKSKETRDTWRRMAQAFGKAAALACLTATPFLAAPDAQGRFNSNGNLPTSGGAPMSQTLNTQCSTTRRRRPGWRAAVAALTVSLAGCATTIAHQAAPADWPQLAIVEHRVKMGDVYETCARYVPTWMKALSVLTLTPPIVEGCAVVNFDSMRCDIYVRGDIPDPAVLAHERLHCAGRDHANEIPVLRDAWRAWRDAMADDGAAYVYVRADGAAVTYRKPR